MTQIQEFKFGERGLETENEATLCAEYKLLLDGLAFKAAFDIELQDVGIQATSEHLFHSWPS